MSQRVGFILCVLLVASGASAETNSTGDQTTTILPKTPHGDVEEISTEPYFNSNLLDTLHFRVPKGDIFLSTRFGTSLADDSTWSWQNTNNTSNSQSWSDLYLSGAYGMNDNLNVGVADSVTTMTGVAQGRTGSSTTYGANGLTEPSFFASYRFLGGLKNDHFASVGFSFSPSVGTAVGATSSSNGNQLRGDSLTALNLNGFKVLGSSEFRGTGNIEYHGAGAYQDANGNNGETWSSYFSYDIAAEYRYHLSSKYFIGGSALLNLPYQVSNSRNDDFSSWTNSDALYLIPELIVGWKISEKLVATADYIYSSRGYTTSYSDSTQGVGSVVQQYVHLTLNSQF